jgi:hypothetical protein
VPNDRRTFDSVEMARRGKMGAHATHSRHSGEAITANGRRTFLARFERQVDPDGTLDPAERARRVEHALKAHMAGLNRLSLQARARTSTRDDGRES